MRVNALVVDLALLGPGAWDFLEKLSAALPGLGIVVCTGRSTVSQRVRGLRLGADDWVTKPCHPEEVLARVEAVVRRRKRASARVETGPLVAGRPRDPGRPVSGLRARPQRRPHPARVRGAAAARPGGGQGAPARGDLPGGVGLRDGPRRPLGGRVRPQGAPEARGGLARTGATSTPTSGWAIASIPRRRGRPSPRRRSPKRPSPHPRSSSATGLRRSRHRSRARGHPTRPAIAAARRRSAGRRVACQPATSWPRPAGAAVGRMGRPRRSGRSFLQRAEDASLLAG